MIPITCLLAKENREEQLRQQKFVVVDLKTRRLTSMLKSNSSSSRRRLVEKPLFYSPPVEAILQLCACVKSTAVQ